MFGNPGNALAIGFQADIQNQVFITLLIALLIVKVAVFPTPPKSFDHSFSSTIN